jgi:thymidine phosphorylase
MGRPAKEYCKHGHKQDPNSRYASGGCKECVKYAASKRQKTNQSKATENRRKWIENNPEKEERYRKKSSRKSQLARSGWTIEKFNTVLSEQKGLCALCNEPFTKENPPCADHEHIVPPKTRGLLHSVCNAGLGMFKDSVEICESAVEYLRKWKEAQNA